MRPRGLIHAATRLISRQRILTVRRRWRRCATTKPAKSNPKNMWARIDKWRGKVTSDNRNEMINHKWTSQRCWRISLSIHYPLDVVLHRFENFVDSATADV